MQLSGDIRHELGKLVWAAPSLLVTEALFIVGACMMAVSVGENLAEFRHPRQWYKGIMMVRSHTRSYAEKLIISPRFSFGFWCNFVGAAGTSIILIVGLWTVAPVTSAGLVAIIVLDLIATFGWRIPLEIARRKVRASHVENRHSSRGAI